MLVEDQFGKCEDASLEDKKLFIMTQLATNFSEDLDFLRKVNKITFGLMSK